jgi:hypothetical protein
MPLGNYLSFELQLKAAVPYGALLFVAALLAFTLSVFLVAWWRAARRVLILERAKSKSDGDLAAVRKALENEIKWRLAGETFAAEIGKTAAGDLELKSTRELQEMLSAESFDGRSSTQTSV